MNYDLLYALLIDNDRTAIELHLVHLLYRVDRIEILNRVVHVEQLFFLVPIVRAIDHPVLRDDFLLYVFLEDAERSKNKTN